MRAKKIKIQLIQILFFVAICAAVTKVQASVLQQKNTSSTTQSEPLKIDTNFSENAQKEKKLKSVKRKGLLFIEKKKQPQKNGVAVIKKEESLTFEEMKNKVATFVNKAGSMASGAVTVYTVAKHIVPQKTKEEWVIKSLKFGSSAAFELWKRTNYKRTVFVVGGLGAVAAITRLLWSSQGEPNGGDSPNHNDNVNDGDGSSKVGSNDDNNSSGSKKPTGPSAPKDDGPPPATVGDVLSPILPALLGTIAGGSYVTFPAYYISARMGGEIMLFFISQLEKWPTSKILRSFQHNVGGKPYFLVVADPSEPVNGNQNQEDDPNNIVQKMIHSAVYYQVKFIGFAASNKESLYWFAMSCCATLLFFLVDFLTPQEDNFEARMKKNSALQILNTFSKEEIKQIESQSKTSYSKMMAIFLFFLTLLFAFSFFLDLTKKRRKY